MSILNGKNTSLSTLIEIEIEKSGFEVMPVNPLQSKFQMSTYY